MIAGIVSAMKEVVVKEISNSPKDIKPDFFNSLEMPSDGEEVSNVKEVNDSEEKNEVTNEYKTVDEALESTSQEERDIYKNANLEKGEVDGRESLQRTDINYDEKDPLGRSNLERMEAGLAPLKDGKPIELHHIGQNMDSPLAELTKEEHMKNGNDTILHDKQKESEIDRSVFNKERTDYWKARAKQIRESIGE